jgi:type I restriction enzyme R subunit
MARLWFQPTKSISPLTKPLLLPKEFDTQSFSQRQCVRKAKTLRDRFQLTKEDGTSFYVRFFNTEDNSKIYFKSPIKSVWKEVTRTVMM